MPGLKEPLGAPAPPRVCLLWVPLGAAHAPVEVTFHPDLVEFEAPDWVPDSVLDAAHHLIFGRPPGPGRGPVA